MMSEIYILAYGGMVLFAVVLGYIMGRNSAGQPVSSQPKQFDPGPTKLDEPDPYQEALEPDLVGKRIATV